MHVLSLLTVFVFLFIFFVNVDSCPGQIKKINPNDVNGEAAGLGDGDDDCDDSEVSDESDGSKGKSGGKSGEKSSGKSGEKSGGKSGEKSSGKSGEKSGSKGSKSEKSKKGKSCKSNKSKSKSGENKNGPRHGSNTEFIHKHGNGPEHTHGIETVHAIEVGVVFTHTHTGQTDEHSHGVPGETHNHDAEFQAAIDAFLANGGTLEGSVSGGGGVAGTGVWTFRGSGQKSADGSFSANGEVVNSAGEVVISGQIEGNMDPSSGEFIATANGWSASGTGQENADGSISGTGSVKNPAGEIVFTGQVTIVITITAASS